jgi:hypothetical protein
MEQKASQLHSLIPKIRQKMNPIQQQEPLLYETYESESNSQQKYQVQFCSQKAKEDWDDIVSLNKLQAKELQDQKEPSAPKIPAWKKFLKILNIKHLLLKLLTLEERLL